MKNNFTILEIKFNFSDWENKTVQKFRDDMENFIGLTNTRSSVLLSNDISKNGVTFYLLTTNPEFGRQAQVKFTMSQLVDNVDLKTLGIEYGNSELIS